MKEEIAGQDLKVCRGSLKLLTSLVEGNVWFLRVGVVWDRGCRPEVVAVADWGQERHWMKMWVTVSYGRSLKCWDYG